MNDFEEQLVRALQQDGRASFSGLAKDLGATRATVAARVNALIDSGQLRVVAAVHPRVLGLNCLAHIAVRLAGDPDAVIEALDAMESPVFISQTTGHYQLAAELRTSTMSSLYRQIELIRSLPQVTAVEVLIYERVIRSLFLGAEPSLPDLDLTEADLRLINLLQHDGRMSLAEMGAQIGLSVSACRARMHRLLEANVMQIGAIRRRTENSRAMAFGLGITTAGPEDEAVGYLQGLPGVEFIVKCIGRFNLVATIGVASLGEYQRSVAGLRRLGSVASVDTWLHTEIVRERYEKSLDALVDAITARS